MFMARKFFSALALFLSLAAVTIATDFTLPTLPKFDTECKLSDHTGQTFYTFLQSDLKNKMNGKNQSDAPDDLLKKGKGVSVKLNDRNYNIHVNFYNDPKSGRSYGWTGGLVGDWSDRAMLDNTAAMTKSLSDQQLKDFYSTLVQMVGNCDAGGLSKLNGMAERVATNFLAIYGAEEYRATLGTKNWDDALFETVMLGAFHAGQKTLTKFYMGKFSTRSYEQAPGIYDAYGAPGLKSATAKAAQFNDYWQFSSAPDSRRSGINLTRPDFEKMGAVITSYEKNNPDLKATEAIVKGSGNNVFKDITRYFANGKANPSDADNLAAAIASFLVQVRKDADKITNTVKITN
jgi:hypothetical protein